MVWLRSAVHDWLVEADHYDLFVDTPTGLAVIQCKFYTHPVGFAAVQEAYTAKALYAATAAVVVSNARFTRQARCTARKLGIHLCSHAGIATILSEKNGNKTW